MLNILECVSAQSLSHSQLFTTPRTVASQAPLPWDFPNKNTTGGLPFPTQRDLPDPGSKSTSPALAGQFFTAVTPRKPAYTRDFTKNVF